jgi:pimeloyl-ACP methyl ester carboxylesterase
MEELIRAGDPDAAARLMLSEHGVATPEELVSLQSPEHVWERIRAGIPTAPREIRAEATPVDLDAARLIEVPVLILLGEKTTVPAILDGLDEFEQALPNVRRATVPGQRHLAVGFAPEVFAERVACFLLTIDQAEIIFPDHG